MIFSGKCRIIAVMSSYRISTVAHLLGVSDDSIRRWLDDGLLAADPSSPSPTRILGTSIVDFLHNKPEAHRLSTGRTTSSLRNQLTGLVVNIVSDTVMSQVEMQCGPYRIVSLISTEAVRDLGLRVGSIANAQIKATNVSIQLPEGDLS